eukprot:s552_g45.t1
MIHDCCEQSQSSWVTLFSNVSQRVLKAETARSNCFCWFLATYSVANCSKKCDFSKFIRLRIGKRLAVALLIMSLLCYIRLAHLRLNAATRGFRASELNSVEIVAKGTHVSNVLQASLTVIAASKLEGLQDELSAKDLAYAMQVAATVDRAQRRSTGEWRDFQNQHSD